MYIIDKTYFIKKISVPNTEEHNSEMAIELYMSIDKYARQFLQFTLNNTLFEDLDSNITNGVLDAGAPQKWLNLVNGCSYIVGDKTYTWKGLAYTEGAYKESILAYYVYLNHYQTTVNTNLGQLVLEGKNAINQNPSEHITDVYNTFVKMYQGSTCNYAREYWNNGLLVRDYYAGESNSGYVSYLQFLQDNIADYPDFSAGVLKFENRFGL